MLAKVTSKNQLTLQIDNQTGALLYTEGGNFSYVHILAHGATVTTQGLEDHQSEWGLRLGGRDSKAASPKALAGALALDKGYPLVVTLAACDSAKYAASRTAGAYSSTAVTKRAGSARKAVNNPTPE